MNNYFPKIFCINLDRRTDRWQNVTQQFAKNNIVVQRVSGYDGQNIRAYDTYMSGARIGCILSHLYCLKTIVNLGLPNAFIFEDDAEFCENFNNKFETFMMNLPADWDVIYLGGNHGQKPQPVNSKVSRVTKTLTTHAYGINQETAKKIIAVLETMKDPADVVYVNMQSLVNCYVPVKRLVWQSSGLSDIEGKYMAYGFLKDGEND